MQNNFTELNFKGTLYFEDKLEISITLRILNDNICQFTLHD